MTRRDDPDREQKDGTVNADTAPVTEPVSEPVAQPEPNLPWWARNSNRPLMRPEQASLRSRKARSVTVGLTLAAVTGLLAVLVRTDLNDTERTRIANTDVTVRKQSVDALVGGCGAIFEFRVPPNSYGTIPSVQADGTVNQAFYEGVTVPTYGPFYNESADLSGKRFWARDETPPPIEEFVHAQYKGWMVVYYTRGADPAGVAALKAIASNEPALKMLVAPWERRRGALPEGRTIAIASWGATQTCHRLVSITLAQFRELHPPSSAPGNSGMPAPTFPGRLHR